MWLDSLFYSGAQRKCGPPPRKGVGPMASAVGLAFLFFVFSCSVHFRLFTDSLLAIPINPQRRSGFPAVWFVHFGDISTLGFKPGLAPLLFNLSPKSAETPNRKEMQKPRGSCMPHRPANPTDLAPRHHRPPLPVTGSSLLLPGERGVPEPLSRSVLPGFSLI